MCGIAGVFDPHHRHRDLKAEVSAMTGALWNRGPDDGGLWVDSERGVALGHRRLAILDLSPAGHQPMTSADGRCVISFNGEIYNHRALRRQLEQEGAVFRSDSDTEVLVEAIAMWGCVRTLEAADGMFAFAVWDRRQRHLTLARDRFGEKPLYFGVHDGALVFGSELKSLREFSRFDATLDTDSIALLLRYKCIPAPYSVYKSCRKLQPGCVITFDESLGEKQVTYWSAQEVAEESRNQSWVGSPDGAVERLHSLLLNAVGERMLSDVPLGAFLSGGIDSSTVVALMQAQSSTAVKTFTVGFDEPEFDEAPYAAAIARHLGTDHTEVRVTAAEMLSVVPRLPEIYNEPFADSSQLPMALVSQVARRDVTVALSGDGGDELFGGYQRYFLADRMWRLTRLMPPRALQAARDALDYLAGSDVGPPRLPQSVMGALPHALRHRSVAWLAGAIRGTRTLREPSREALYRSVLSDWRSPSEAIPGAVEPQTPPDDPSSWMTTAPFAEHMMMVDTLCYLPDDILAKVDRASMAVSLEARVPILDPDVFAFAWRLPHRLRVQRSEPKWPLRQVLYRYVPQELVDRPKRGFGVPLDKWLRGPLREWADELLGQSALEASGIFEAAPIRQLWEQHLSGEWNWQNRLWSALAAQAWLQAQKP